MALLTILQFPDLRLHKVAAPVDKIDASIRQIAKDMAQTMYAAAGIGLAATQVDIHQRIIVIDISEERNQLITLINPEILWASEAKKAWTEGCLSVPNIFEMVERPEHIRVRAQNLDGDFFELDADGLLAVCIQHEIDHLAGKVFVEYLSQLKQNRVRTRLKKQARRIVS